MIFKTIVIIYLNKDKNILLIDDNVNQLSPFVAPPLCPLRKPLRAFRGQFLLSLFILLLLLFYFTSVNTKWVIQPTTAGYAG